MLHCKTFYLIKVIIIVVCPPRKCSKCVSLCSIDSLFFCLYRCYFIISLLQSLFHSFIHLFHSLFPLMPNRTRRAGGWELKKKEEIMRLCERLAEWLEEHGKRWSQGKTFLYDGVSWPMPSESGDTLLNQCRTLFTVLWMPVCPVKCFVYKEVQNRYLQILIFHTAQYF